MKITKRSQRRPAQVGTKFRLINSARFPENDPFFPKIGDIGIVLKTYSRIEIHKHLLYVQFEDGRNWFVTENEIEPI